MLGVIPSYSTGFAQWPGMSEYPQLWEGLVASYAPFLGATGNKVFDLSGKNQTGTFVGTAPSWSSGKFCRAVLLPGTDEYIQLTSLYMYDDLEPHTYIAWIYLNAIPTGTYYIVVCNSDGSSHGDDLCIHGDKICALLRGGGVARDANTSLTTGRWYQIAMVWNNGVTFYLDGVPDGTGATYTWATGTSAARIGAWFDASKPFNGLISQVMIYNCALSSSEIALLYQIMKRLVT